MWSTLKLVYACSCSVEGLQYHGVDLKSLEVICEAQWSLFMIAVALWGFVAPLCRFEVTGGHMWSTMKLLPWRRLFWRQSLKEAPLKEVLEGDSFEGCSLRSGSMRPSNLFAIIPPLFINHSPWAVGARPAPDSSRSNIFSKETLILSQSCPPNLFAIIPSHLLITSAG